MFTSLTKTVCTLGLLFVIGGVLLLPKIADAQVSVVVNGGSGSRAQIGTLNASNNILAQLQMLVNKEYNLDVNQARLSDQALRAYYEQTKQFVAHGDNSSEYWYANWEIFEAALEANVANDAIESLSGSAMCGAFQNEAIASIKRSLIEENTQSVAQKQSCDLDTATENGTEAFTGGHADADAVQGFWTAARDPYQTPKGAEQKAKQLVREEVEEAKEILTAQANRSNGFKDRLEAGQTIMSCLLGDANGIRNNCRITTPGIIIQQRAAKLLDIEQALLTGDEIGETEMDMVNAVLQPTFAGGLTGRAAPVSTTPPTPPANGGGNGTVNCTTLNPLDPLDPFPCVPNDVNNPLAQSFLVQVTSSLNQSGTTSTSTNPVRPILIRTLTRLQYLLETVELVNNLEARHASTSAAYAPYNCFNVNFSFSLTNERLIRSQQLPLTIDAIKHLYALHVRYEQALTNNTSTNQILADLQGALQLSVGIMPTQAELVLMAEEFDNFLSIDVAPYNSQYNQGVAACELIINPPQS